MHDSPLFGRFAGVISRHAGAIIGLLMMVAGGLMALAPNLEELALTHGSPMMPTNTQSAAALKHMAKAFGESESNNTAAVVVVKDKPFTEEDRQFRAELMKKLRADTAHVEPGMDMCVAVGIATPIASFLTLAGLIPTSMMTNALMGALALGAGTDYSIFFIGRYQEGRRAGLSVEAAFRAGYRGVAPVVIASGLTVAGALSCMTFA